MYHAIIGTERKQTQELHLHHNRFVEMFVFSSAASHLWEKKEISFHRLLAHLTCMISYYGG